MDYDARLAILRDCPGGNVSGGTVRDGCPHPVQDCKSPRVAFVIWVIEVNTQTHRQTDSFWPVMYKLSQPS